MLQQIPTADVKKYKPLMLQQIPIADVTTNTSC
jgi:hypothetical protein